MNIPPGIDPFVLISAFIMHTGSRKDNLTDAQKDLVDHPVSKLTIILGLFYITTRNIKWSIILLLLYYVLIFVLLNEKHPMNILSYKWLLNKGYISDPSTWKSWNLIDIYIKKHTQLTKSDI